MRPGGAIYKTAPETTKVRKVHARMKDVNDLKLNPLRAIVIGLLCDIGFCLRASVFIGIRESTAGNPGPDE